MINQNIIRCCEVLLKKKLTIAFAESATAGRVASEFSLVHNAGHFLKGGLVCYDAGVKEKLLNVPKALIDEFTPESMEVTKAAAIGLTKLIDAAIHVAVIGLPAPGGSETATKPVGTMFIYGIYQGEELFAERIVFNGEQEEIILKTTYHLAETLARCLETE